MTDLADAAARVPALAGADLSGARRLAGLTNINHLVATPGGPVVVRLPGIGTSEYLDRRAEAVAARVAAEAGVNAPLLFFDDSDGLMVTRFVEGAVTMDAEGFRDLGSVARAATVLRTLHGCGGHFANDFALFPMIDEFKTLIFSKGAKLPAGYDGVQEQAGAARTALEAHPAVLVPCHCDPLCENFLDTGERMYLIDYEYSGNNDPMWDLGDLSVEAGFSPGQDAALLHAYFEGDPPADQVGRMIVHKAMCDLLWTLWGVLQHANGNPLEDFWAYATDRFERCRALMASPEFGEAVAAIH